MIIKDEKLIKEITDKFDDGLGFNDNTLEEVFSKIYPEASPEDVNKYASRQRELFDKYVVKSILGTDEVDIEVIRPFGSFHEDKPGFIYKTAYRNDVPEWFLNTEKESFVIVFDDEEDEE